MLINLVLLLLVLVLLLVSLLVNLVVLVVAVQAGCVIIGRLLHHGGRFGRRASR